MYIAFLLPVVSFYLFLTLEQQISQKRKNLTESESRFKFTPFSFFRQFLSTTKHQHFLQAWQFPHSAFRPLKMSKISKLPGASPPGLPLYQDHFTTSISYNIIFFRLMDPWILYKNWGESKCISCFENFRILKGIGALPPGSPITALPPISHNRSSIGLRIPQ